MILQEGSVVATYYVPGAERVRAFIWNWKTGDRLDVSSEELLGGTVSKLFSNARIGE